VGDSGEPRGPSGRRAGLRYGLAAAIGAVLAGAVLLVSAQDRVDHAAEVNLSAPGPLDSYLRGESRPIDRVPLGAELVARLMGIPEIASVLPAGGVWSMYTESIAEPGCVGARYVAVDGFYATVPGARRDSMSKRAFVAPILSPGPTTDSSDLAVINYPDPGAARAVFAAAATAWRGCADRDIHVTAAGPGRDGEVWSAGPVREERGVLSLLLTRRATEGDPEPWQCEHALTVAGAVVVDVDACGATVAPGTAVRLAEATAVRADVIARIPGYRRSGG